MNRSSSVLFALLLSSVTTVACQADVADETEGTEGAASVAGQAVLDVPFYFSVTKESLTDMTAAERQHPYATGWNRARDAQGGFLSDVGLRTITIDDTGNHARARQSAGENLGKAGVIQTGDIIVTFRPELANTIPYAHIQMGTTHAGIARVVGSTARSVDQPLDSEHNSPGKSFQSSHYMGLNAFHIIRPRGLDATQRKNLDQWIGLAERLIGSGGRPGFNDNYLTPAIASPTIAKNPASPEPSEVAKLSTSIGKGLINGNVRAVVPDMDAKANEQQLFCSEMAYHLLALSNCSPDEVSGAGDTAACAEAGLPFAPLNLVGASEAGGLGEGPLLTINQAGLGSEFGNMVFATGNAGSPALSSGHRDANAMLVSFGVVDALKSVYVERVGNASAGLSPQVQGINAKMPANYSPTAFLIDTLKPRASRQFDYVATVVFAQDSATLETAKALSKQPIPHTAQ